jgi:outer membrane protein OmpA-like peptidoglycan-associated protein
MLTVDPTQLQFLHAVQKDGPLSVTVHHTPQGDIIDNLDIITKRVPDSTAAEVTRVKQAEIARRIQDLTITVTEALRLQIFINAALMQLAEKEHEPPKPSVAALKFEIGKPIVLEGIVFQSGTAIILPESEQILSSAKKTMEENPEIKVEIRGYTNNAGTAKKNQQISNAQAKSVKVWLVKHGIASDRITTKGYGSKNPIGNNKTDDGRKRNSQIEFLRTK